VLARLLAVGNSIGARNARLLLFFFFFASGKS
jgi:hypothetical protein